MSADRPRLSYVSERAGALVILTLLVVAMLTAGAWRAQGWFEPVIRFDVKLPESGSEGLGRGSHVWVVGTDVGTVENVLIEEGHMTAKVRMSKQFGAFVRQDSRATIRKTWGVAGDAYLEISRGTGEPLPEHDAELVARSDLDASDLLTQVIDQIRTEAIPMMTEVRAAVSEYTGLARDLRSAEGPFQQLVARANSITGSVDRGDGVLGKLVMDKQLGDDAKQIIAKANEASDELMGAVRDAKSAIASINQIAKSAEKESGRIPEVMVKVNDALTQLNSVLNNVEAASRNAPSAAKVIGDEVKSLPGLVMQAQQTLREIERLTKAIQNNWLVRDAVEPDAPMTRLPADSVIGGGGPVGGPRGGPGSGSGGGGVKQ